MVFDDETREMAELIVEASSEFADDVLRLITNESLSNPNASPASLLDAVYLESSLDSLEGFRGVLAAAAHFNNVPNMIAAMRAAQEESGSL